MDHLLIMCECSCPNKNSKVASCITAYFNVSPRKHETLFYTSAQSIKSVLTGPKFSVKPSDYLSVYIPLNWPYLRQGSGEIQSCPNLQVDSDDNNSTYEIEFDWEKFLQRKIVLNKSVWDGVDMHSTELVPVQ